MPGNPKCVGSAQGCKSSRASDSVKGKGRALRARSRNSNRGCRRLPALPLPCAPRPEAVRGRSRGWAPDAHPGPAAPGALAARSCCFPGQSLKQMRLSHFSDAEASSAAGGLAQNHGKGWSRPGQQIGPLGGRGLPAPEGGCAFKGCLLEVAPTPGASAPARQPARTAGGAPRLSPPLAPSDTCLPLFTRFRSSFSGRPLGSSGGEAVSADPAAGSHLPSFERSRGPASEKSHPAGRESVCSCVCRRVCGFVFVHVCAVCTHGFVRTLCVEARVHACKCVCGAACACA